MLSKETTLLELHISQVHLDQKVNIASVRDFGKWVIVSLQSLSTNCGLKLQVLACKMAKGLFLFGQGEPVYESVRRQLFFIDEGHRNGLVNFLNQSTVVINLRGVLVFNNKRVHRNGGCFRAP